MYFFFRFHCETRKNNKVSVGDVREGVIGKLSRLTSELADNPVLCYDMDSLSFSFFFFEKNCHGSNTDNLFKDI